MWARENNGLVAVVTVCVIERDKPMCVYTDRSQLALTMLQLIVFRILGGGAYLVLSCYDSRPIRNPIGNVASTKMTQIENGAIRVLKMSTRTAHTHGQRQRHTHFS